MTFVGLYGGAFNMPTVGHVLSVAYILATQDIETLFVIPTYQHALGKDLVSFEHRFAMCRLAFEGLLEGDRIHVSEVERELGGISYTLRTVTHLKNRLGGRELRWIVGSDCEQNKVAWGDDWEKINEVAPFLILDRAGYPTRESHRPVIYDVSSTEARARIKTGQDASKLVPRKVLEYIRKHNLYIDS